MPSRFSSFFLLVGLLLSASCAHETPALQTVREPSETPPLAYSIRPGGRPALQESRVELAQGAVRFRGGAAFINGAEFSLGEAWWLDVDGDGELEALADVSYCCDNVDECGNAWGGYLAAWRWRAPRGGREGGYELLATADRVKVTTWLRKDGDGLRLGGWVKTGTGRNDVDDRVVGLRLVGERLVVQGL